MAAIHFFSVTNLLYTTRQSDEGVQTSHWCLACFFTGAGPVDNVDYAKPERWQPLTCLLLAFDCTSPLPQSTTTLLYSLFMPVDAYQIFLHIGYMFFHSFLYVMYSTDSYCVVYLLWYWLHHLPTVSMWYWQCTAWLSVAEIIDITLHGYSAISTGG